MLEIKITQGKNVKVSEEDFEQVAEYSWAFSASTRNAVTVNVAFAVASKLKEEV